jgi:hypothetical protein
MIALNGPILRHGAQGAKSLATNFLVRKSFRSHISWLAIIVGEATFELHNDYPNKVHLQGGKSRNSNIRRLIGVQD